MGVTLPSLKERGPTESLSSRKAETDQGTTSQTVAAGISEGFPLGKPR